MTRCLTRFTTFAATLTAALIFGHGLAGADDAASIPPVGSRIMIRTTSGEFIDAKLVEVRPDTIQLRKGKRDIAVPINAVEGTWKWRRDPIRGLAFGAGYGALIGAIQGFGLPGDCLSCDDERGSTGVVLRRALVSAAEFGLSGLIGGILYGAWEVHPGIAPGRTPATGPPFQPRTWSATTGRSWDLERGTSFTTISVTRYRNSSPRWAWGSEFGILKFPVRREREGIALIPSPDSIGAPTAVRLRSGSEHSLSYGTILLARARGTQGPVRAQFQFGPAIYAQHGAYFTEHRDSSGVVTATTSGSGVTTNLGLMGGVGAMFGRGVIRPSVRARWHWFLSESVNYFVTVEAGAEFH